MPESRVRDIAEFPGFQRDNRQKYSLALMAELFLNKKIQSGAHCSVEDAVITMELYKLKESEIEAWNKVRTKCSGIAG